MATYFIENMRVVFPQGKVAEKNPDRWATVHGTFYAAVHKGDKVTRGEKLSIPQKEVTVEMAADPTFAIDPVAGILTVPSGQKGAPRKEGASAEDIAASLAALRGTPTA